MPKNVQPLLKYDRDLLNQDVPIADVMERYLGEKPDKSGKVKCPSVQHTDKKPSASLYTKNNQNHCYCFACAEKFTPISIVMENITNGNFPQACETLIRDFGLPLSRYSNYDEIQAQLKGSQNGFIETFPLTAEDCQALNLTEEFEGKIANRDGTVQRIPTLSSEWAKDKEGIEAALLKRCKDKSDFVKELIAEETACFYNMYAAHTEEEWKKAEEWQTFREEHNLSLVSAFKLPETGRELANDLIVLHGICERIADLQDYCEVLEKIPNKIIDNRRERKSLSRAGEKPQTKPWSEKSER